MEDVVVGIDLGTTNCCVAAIQDGRPTIIEDERGYNILPSCVAFRSKGKFVVGHGAKALVPTNPDQTVYAIKRLIGRKFTSEEVQAARPRLSYQLFEGVNDEVLLRLGEVELTPVEVASVIVKCIREVAERALDTEVQRAVVTVPAYFNHSQRAATKEAVELAGLECMRLINEPTAAALAYGFKKDLEKRIAIYDLGGGTFDISVLEISGGLYETLATSGNSFLGGEDFDYRVVDHLAEQVLSEHGVDLRESKMSLQRLKDASERARCELSFVDKTPILIPRIHDALNLETTLTRTTVEGLVDDLIRETIRITSEALRDANVVIEDLDEIVLVGGLTRMPKVQEAIRAFFGMSPCKGVHPEEVVAIGAAVQAYSLEEESEGHLLLDVTPFSLGIDTAGGYFGKVIGRNTTIPMHQARTFTTVNDNQDEVKIIVRQGESNVADENEFLGEFTLEGIRPAPRMIPRIDVTFKIDANGILHVSAVDRDTGEKKTVKIRDYIEKASDHESTTDIQLADNAGVGKAIVAGKAGAGAAPQGKGLFGKLKGMFGREQVPASTTTELAEKGATLPPTASDSVELQDRSDAAGASTEVQDRTSKADESAEAQDRTDEIPVAPDAAPTPAPSSMSATDSTELEERIASQLSDASGPIPMPGPTTDPGISAELRASLGALFDTDPGSGGPEEPTAEAAIPALEMTGDDEVTTAPGQLAEAQAMAPVDERAATATDEPVFGLPGAVEPDDPFALDESPDLDPFAADQPMQGDPAGTQDTFEGTGTDAAQSAHSIDTQVQTKPDITPATYGLSDDPEAAAASRKKPAKLKIRYKKAATFTREISENLERGGTYIKTPKPLERGRRCVFELSVPGFDGPMRLRGFVVWSSRGATELPEGQSPGMAIDYDPEDTEALDAVRAAVEKLK